MSISKFVRPKLPKRQTIVINYVTSLLYQTFRFPQSRTLKEFVVRKRVEETIFVQEFLKKTAAWQFANE